MAYGQSGLEPTVPSATPMFFLATPIRVRGPWDGEPLGWSIAMHSAGRGEGMGRRSEAAREPGSPRRAGITVIYLKTDSIPCLHQI